MMTLLDKYSITFEEILQLFTNIDTPEKGAAFRQKLSAFLKNKSDAERKLYGSVMLSITQDNAIQLLRNIKDNKDLETLDNLEKALMDLKR